ncbi:MAG TPA: alpha/beta hydrolase [Candidatus Acidoferrum sp.]|jgi:pimeloyl-ACP methyl ester carboxylesterase|nr:alpha/beta hydrolase [Candidatus Acidoferrum sp.]
MPTVELPASPHAPRTHPVTIHYREYGSGEPLIFLHSGWGYRVYPFEKQIKAFEGQFRILIPDRSGYGHSTPVTGEMSLDFHWRAAAETAAFLDKLGIGKAILWGHSDGAVIAAMMGINDPQRCACLILEAIHFLKRKPGSRSFFERFAARPDELGEETRHLLVEDHGEEYWTSVIRRNCEVWIRMAGSVRGPEDDVYEGRLSELAVPTLCVHGRCDPRTEPGEMERVGGALPRTAIRFIENGRHSPHSEEAASEECSELAQEFWSALDGSTR